MTEPTGLCANSDGYLRITLTDSKTGKTIPFPDGGTPATVVVTLVDALGVTQLNSMSVPFSGVGGVYEYLAAATAFPIAGTYTATWVATDSLGRKRTRIEPVIVVQ